jgi:hypothetical protein
MTTEPIQPAAPVPSPAPVVAVPPRSRSGGVLNILLIVAAALALGGVAFAVGRSTAPVTTLQGLGNGPIVRPGGSFTPGAGGPNGGFGIAGGLSIDGTVTAVDADSITLTLANGNEMTFTLDDETTYHEATDAGAADVAVGDDVSVQVGSDGRAQLGGDGGTATELTAGDVTVSR